MKELEKLNNEHHLHCLLDKWCFYTLKDFIEELECEGITEYDGFGRFVYIDKDFNLYESSADVINICSKYDFFSIGKLQKKLSTKEYKLFGVFWFNK